MATNTSSPTPSEDNRQNTRDDCMYNALDMIMGNPVQSYDEFLNSFTYLKPGSQAINVEKIKKEDKKKVNTKNPKQDTKPTAFLLESKLAGSLLEAKPAGPLKETSKATFKNSQEIEEETLDEGNTSNRLLQSKAVRTGSLVKFDNYVECVDEADDIEEMSNVPVVCEASAGGYSASFTAGTRSRIDKAAASAAASRRPQSHKDEDLSQTMEAGLSLDENSTDKLLLNFLADLQNELNEGQVQGQTQANREPAISHSGTDIQNFLDREKNKKIKISSQKSDESNDTERNDDVNFDDEGDDMMLLCDDSKKSSVRVTLSEQELKGIESCNKADEEEKRKKLTSVYKDTLMDSEGVIRTPGATTEWEVKETAQNNVNPEDVLFPGQVEEKNDKPTSKNQTFLDFKAIYRQAIERADNNMQVEETCLIQPFQLDKDFDYDNVVVAPKFSSEDLQQLKLQRQPVEMK